MDKILPLRGNFGTILITGGTGSLSKIIINRLRNYHNITYKNIIIYSRDEAKQTYFDGQTDITKVIGDVRDRNKLDLIVKRYNVKTIIHTAALKRINDLEYYPDECVQTNIEGSNNVAYVAQENNVKKCILTSTDKATLPVNVYGASKFIAERIFSNYAFHSEKTKFCSVRYGNVIASRGSFIPIWYEKIIKGEEIPVTSLECTRFLFTLNDAADFVLYALTDILNGAIFIPKLDSFTMKDIINSLVNISGDSVVKKPKIKIIGMRPGEKIHEDMISEFESQNVAKMENANAIIPDYYNNRYRTFKINPMNSKNYINHDIKYLTELLKRGLGETE